VPSIYTTLKGVNLNSGPGFSSSVHELVESLTPYRKSGQRDGVVLSEVGRGELRPKSADDYLAYPSPSMLIP